jgi:uncharacterized protein
LFQNQPVITPFIFGKLAVDQNFTDRSAEILKLKQNFVSGINTILISPRRWGKSSLVKKAAKEVEAVQKNIRIIYLDMFNIRTEEDFYRRLSEAVLKADIGKLEESLGYIKKFLKHWIPKVTVSPDAVQEMSLSLNWEDVKKNPDEILDLAESIAIEKKLRFVICIDEFQNLSNFSDPVGFQKKIRSHWQQHQHVTYCLYGSKRHMMIEVFTRQSMPFYKFGDLIFLPKISTNDWKIFIRERFEATNKNISEQQAEQIAMLVENHPYYVQQLSQLCWFRASVELVDEDIDLAMESLVMQLSLLFQNITENLATTQVNYLKALVDQVRMLSSKETINTYRLGSSANVSRIREALINKEIIDDQAVGNPEIQDPVYKYWLKNYYFTR